MDKLQEKLLSSCKSTLRKVPEQVTYKPEKSYSANELKFPGTIEYLKEKSHFQQLIDTLFAKEWVVYLHEGCRFLVGKAFVSI